MSGEPLNDCENLSKNEEWVQVAIDNKDIKYEKYSDFKIVEKIGEGSMGEVFKATSTSISHETNVALKKFKKLPNFTINEVINEVKKKNSLSLLL